MYLIVQHRGDYMLSPGVCMRGDMQSCEGIAAERNHEVGIGSVSWWMVEG